jgi:hypothetical protein
MNWVTWLPKYLEYILPKGTHEGRELQFLEQKMVFFWLFLHIQLYNIVLDKYEDVSKTIHKLLFSILQDICIKTLDWALQKTI